MCWEKCSVNFTENLWKNLIHSVYQALSPPPKGPGDDMDEATSVYINTCLHEVKIEAHPHTAKEKSASYLLVYEGMDWLIYPILLVLDLPLLMHIKRYNCYVVLGRTLFNILHARLYHCQIVCTCLNPTSSVLPGTTVV